MNKLTELQIGKAGEYLVCADLILNSHIAFLSEQGLPFDIVFQYAGKLLKVQVKTTQNYKNTSQRKSNIPIYQFHIGRNGAKGSRKNYYKDAVDIFALVSLDTKRIAYLPYFNTQSTMNFRVPELRGSYKDEIVFEKRKEVLILKKSGLSPIDVSFKTGVSVKNVYNADRLSKVLKTNYFDDYTLEKCIKKLSQHNYF